MMPKRKDSARNRELILTAAEEVFARHGPAAPLDLVANAAGVGRATLYRNFADRPTLLLALFEQSLQALENMAAEVAEREDALFVLLRFSGDHITSRSAMFEQIGTLSPDDPTLREARARFRRLFEGPLARAIGAGLCRADLTSSDLIMISAMLSGAVRGHGSPTRTEVGARALGHLIDGLRPRSA